MPFLTKFRPLSEVTLHVAEAGPEHGPPTILLHGFPEFWWGWRSQIEILARAGLRVIAPDQRGYNLSSKPVGVAAYNLDLLARDIVELVDSYGAERVSLVGQDWGGVVASWVATKYPSRLNKLILINAPHPLAAFSYLRRHPGQMLRSAYIGFFQIARLPELMLQGRDYALLVRSLKRSSRLGTFSAEDLAQYRRAWAQPGALTAMINWYRAILRMRNQYDPGKLQSPTLILW